MREKITNLEYDIVNVDLEHWVTYKPKMAIDRIQPRVVTNMSFNALTEPRFQSCIFWH